MPDVQDRNTSPADTTNVSVAGGAWARFARAHLYDYSTAATRLWLAIALTGGVVFAVMLAQLAAEPLRHQVEVLVGLAVVAVAAFFPVQIPRTKHSIGVADVLVFLLLALYGVPAAVLAAAVEGFGVAVRSSTRLTSRVGTPASAATAMGLCGLAYLAAARGLVAGGWSAPAAAMAALPAASLIYFVASTLPLTMVVALKRGERLGLANWFASHGLVGGVYLVSAAAAAVLYLNSVQFGRAVIVTAVAVVLAVVALLRAYFRRQEIEHQQQEVRIASAQLEAERNQQRFIAAFTHAAIGMAIVRADGTVLRSNKALHDLLHLDAAAVLARPFHQLLHQGDVALLRRHTTKVVAGSGEMLSMEVRCLRSDGAEVWVSLYCSRFDDPSSDGSCLIYQLHDITSRRQVEGELHHVAYHDSLTDLANRNCFRERLEVAVERSRVDPGQRFAVLYLDLDRFKIVNDSLGQGTGNELLKEVGARLSACVRPHDLVARLGGDEFAVLLEDLRDSSEAVGLANRMLRTLAAPLRINGTELRPNASIGITFADTGARLADELLRDADLAMYEAKANGGGRIALFDSVMRERIAERLQFENDLRKAIGDGGMSLAYQPLYNLESGSIIGFEALARWVHPEHGPISPERFVPLAEETGQIEALTAWVIDCAAGQLADWHRVAPNLTHLCMHINVSGRDLAHSALVPQVRKALRQHNLAPCRVILEITESTLMRRLDVALEILCELRELGVKLCIDDFGTGYSSLAYLSKLPIDVLKIDRSFVLGMKRQPQDLEILRAVLMLGRSLNKEVIAEGIDAAEQLASLRQIGVSMGQGYFLSQPLSADEASSRLELEIAGSA